MTPVRVSPRAQADLVEITSCLAFEAGYAVAARYEREINSQIELLSDFPGVGTRKPNFGKGVRMLVEAPYLIYYEPDEHGILILRILDGRRRITRKLVRKGGD